MLKTLALLAGIAATPVAASTFHHGQIWAGQLTGEQVLTFSAPYATPCGNGDWSMCSYQGGGSILAVSDAAACNGWCGTTLGSFNLSAYQPSQSLAFDFSKWAGYWIVVHFTGQGPVSFERPTNQTVAAAPPAAAAPAPAPVPLPASLPLMAGGVLALAAIRARRKT